MNKPIFAALTLIVLASCTTDKRADVIAAHEQTIGNTKIDLNLKVKSIEDVGVVTASDSLKSYQDYFFTERDKKLEYFNNQLSNNKKYLSEAQADYKKASPYVKDIYADRITRYKDEIAFTEKAIELYNGNCQGTFLEHTYNKMEELKAKNDSVLANKVKATYTIVNPMLNNAKQEITNVYYFTPDNSQIIRKEAQSI